MAGGCVVGELLPCDNPYGMAMHSYLDGLYAGEIPNTPFSLYFVHCMQSARWFRTIKITSCLPGPEGHF